MIALTKLNGAKVLVNPDLIRTVEETPDTLVKFVDGETLMVRESAQELSSRFLAYKRAVATLTAPLDATKETTTWT